VSGNAVDPWSGATYERIAETFTAIHDRIVESLYPRPGERVLDAACGTGGIALRAARAGAEVVGVDISPDQIAKAQRAAELEGLPVAFDVGDCQQLPYADGEFDVVVSAFGAIFAPDHTRTASELARVCKSGGRLALTSWPRDEWSETHVRAGRTFQDEIDAREWGDPDHVRALLGHAFDLEFDAGEWVVEAESPEALWEMLSTSVPPLRAWLAEQDEETRERAEHVYLEYLRPSVLRRRYVLVLGRRR
jgi:ubiquinone/menaquinone biosynthesis C-methylase UbiE